MLRIAALGLMLYGLHAVVVGAADLMGASTLEWWANVWLVLSGAALMLAAVFVRVSMPGGLALAVGGLLGLQSISLHNDPHIYGRLLLLPQLARVGFATALALLAYLGWETGGGSAPDGEAPDKQG